MARHSLSYNDSSKWGYFLNFKFLHFLQNLWSHFEFREPGFLQRITLVLPLGNSPTTIWACPSQLKPKIWLWKLQFGHTRKCPFLGPFSPFFGDIVSKMSPNMRNHNIFSLFQISLKTAWNLGKNLLANMVSTTFFRHPIVCLRS